jgi:hypothetical protein
MDATEDVEWDPSYSISLNEEQNSILINSTNNSPFELSFYNKAPFILTLREHIHNTIQDIYEFDGICDSSSCLLKIIQSKKCDRIEFELESKGVKEININPKNLPNKALIDYPFGIEETKRTNTQALNFLWLQGKQSGLLFMQKNSQNFLIEQSSFIIKNLITSQGHYEFAISVTESNDYQVGYREYIEYESRLIGTILQDFGNYSIKSYSFMTIDPSVVLINLWRRENNNYLRIFNPSYETNHIILTGLSEKSEIMQIDLRNHEKNSVSISDIELKPWKIGTYKI